MGNNRIVVVLDGGEVTQVLADNSEVEVLLVNGDDSSFTSRPDIEVDAVVVDEYFN